MAKKKLQVFISSTYIDLIDERQSAVQAVLDSGHIPAGMELFKAGNETQLETIYRWIDSSDVYMLILGGRYGSVDIETQKSYTRLEYEYALEKGIPIFSVVLTDEFLKTKSLVLEKEKVYEQSNKEKYNDFKDLVLSKIVRMVNDSKDIMLAVHTTLHDFLEDYDLVGWIRENELEANTELLNQINEMNKENRQLHEIITDIRSELNAVNSTFESNLVFEGGIVTILGSYTESSGTGYNIKHRTRNITKDITWDELFLLWSPRLTATLNSVSAKHQLEYCLRDYVGRSFSLNDNQFHKIKIQYSALGLLNYRESRTTKGGTAEFISLTKKGRKYLEKSIAIKKEN